jgi:hypothetical protein
MPRLHVSNRGVRLVPVIVRAHLPIDRTPYPSEHLALITRVVLYDKSGPTRRVN